ncbi:MULTISPECIES: histidinol-phosphate transaminase [Planktothricoides]|uniref:Histidinol-phosphate aminotransferase n=2 Tax=Planktothricoides raciborskii TaxID=132608 RepID=A0AAU8J9I4_9CYAN|nr:MULTISPECIES: histidinol-phosphate transaminase [Planktothricoides]KOR37070.1 histidinol-phosphate aminotransferase [Planktothricoides sp. SR001]MBD2544682.1 histidinol-phosphate transaminase [Planktothricoides raciborskii FACHB-1370]MBD2580766.1 histidinol-phosphate transaminase [Planktothricoides raciborskii FACHB-1261]
MLSFIRSDLAQFTAYTPHPGGCEPETDRPVMAIDRLDTNECPYDLPGDLKEKLAWVYQKEIENNRYPDGGHIALKEAIAAYVNEASPESPVQGLNISVGNGSDELIRSLLIATCLGGSGAILVANPTFSMYAIIAKTLGIPVVEVGRSETTFEIDLTAAQEAILHPQRSAIASTENPPIRAVFLVHPNSPTANPLSEAELNWIGTLPPEIMVVIDEAYFEFSQTTLVGKLPQHPNWVILRTFSKAFRLASHRVGYAIAHPELIAILEKVRLPYNLPGFTQAAAQTALLHRQTLLQAIPEIIQERDRLYNALVKIPQLQVWPSGANFIYVRLKNTSPAQMDPALSQIAQQLKAQGTLIRHTGGGLRITIGTPEENQRTLERLQGLNL